MVYHFLSPPCRTVLWENYSLYLSSNLLSTLSPAAWGRAEESVVRTKRMVEPVKDKEEENFFCGPPGKLQHGQS